MRKWQMQQAKAKFAEVVKRATSEGPQIVTYRGADAAVILSMEEL
jgi:antitoxin Phd